MISSAVNTASLPLLTPVFMTLCCFSLLMAVLFSVLTTITTLPLTTNFPRPFIMSA